MNDKQRLSLEVINEACDTFKCQKVFALFSGGDDSLAALRVAIEHPRFRAAVHCNTGIGVEATRDFVRETCRKLRCPLIEYKASENVNAKGQADPQIYEQMVMQYGFPGPTKFGHGKMYNRLKERGVARLMREEVGKGQCAVLASGCRSDESTRRMGTTTRICQGTIYPSGHVNKRWIWTNHIHDWTKTDTYLFRKNCGLDRNPVSKLICKSGECLCGAFGKEDELEELLMHDLTRPVGLYIKDLEKKVWDAGFPWKWHERPPKEYLAAKKGKALLAEMAKYSVGLMCQGCENKAADEAILS